jgi:hypothetical protein
MLYFFRGRTVVVVSHGIAKERRRVFESSPEKHAFKRK